ncbi:hypothetical protein BO86DRAFT_391166 [Aspergillus japonicus CBS 114.51]|uniref:Uncharacterized protein n=1 Tax=Aspergillus japonicus CBS 114.51 TaxID=1448312 RepID=A0A8T8WV33_ASPJA|nr:hypothetical protein BO86DRAFT_391166 [Aspergillus japonicus CBS 114.51]RAH79302.1 hypothetical protein BO86DRAFT_391166 [Aspergillus japonicus CBS 114.51]
MSLSFICLMLNCVISILHRFFGFLISLSYLLYLFFNLHLILFAFLLLTFSYLILKCVISHLHCLFKLCSFVPFFVSYLLTSLISFLLFALLSQLLIFIYLAL